MAGVGTGEEVDDMDRGGREGGRGGGVRCEREEGGSGGGGSRVRGIVQERGVGGSREGRWGWERGGERGG